MSYLTNLITRSTKTLILLIMSGALVASAALAPLTPPPAGGYDTGINSILDPGCIPGATDCFVKNPIPTGGSAGQTLTTNGAGVYSWSNPTASSVPAAGVTGAGDVTATSSKITLSGTPIGAVLKPFAIDVNEGNLSLQNIGGSLSNTQLGVLNIANIGGMLSTAQQNAINFSNLAGSVNLTSQVSGILPVANGGTGLSSVGTAGQVLTSNGTTLSYTTPTADWSLTGNSGTTAGTNFIGTTDAQDLVVKTNGTERMRVLSGGKVGIGNLGTLAANLTEDFTIGSTGGSKLKMMDGAGTWGTFAPVGAIAFATDSGRGLIPGNSYLYSPVSTGSYYRLGYYGHEIATGPLDNANNKGLLYNTNVANTGAAYYTQDLLSFNGTITGSQTVDSMLRGLRTTLTDNSTRTNTLTGLSIDVSGGSNTNAIRYAGLFMGGNVGIGTTNPANKLEITQGTAGNSGLRFTNLLSTNTPIAGNGKFLTVNSTGDVVLSNGSGALQWYAENIAAPTTAPVATGLRSIAIGNNAKALASDMFAVGFNAGSSASGAASSIFIGGNAGNGATNAYQSVFLGDSGPGFGATNAYHSNFIGWGAGAYALSANNSNFMGDIAGQHADNANNSNFFGQSAGENATNASGSNFFGDHAGFGATDAVQSHFLGRYSGFNATDATRSAFIGDGAGYAATNAHHSNFIGAESGSNAIHAYGSNFLGWHSGENASNATYSFFAGQEAGFAAGTTASYDCIANAMGTDTCFNSNFIGHNAGYAATDATRSNFFGWYAGANATNANHSNFIGFGAGRDAVNASTSIFLGAQAGDGATDANNSIFIGYLAGISDTVNNSTGTHSILIGDSTSTGGFSNSIALGAQAINTTSNQFMVGNSSGTGIDTMIITATNGNTCTTDILGGVAQSCTSDERRKTNITDLSNTETLEKLLKVRTVSYNWKTGNTTKNNIGFLAQDIQQYFPEVVTTDPNGYYAVSYGNMTPMIISAIKQLNLKVDTAILASGNTDGSIMQSIANWLGDRANGIKKLVVKDEICIDDVCMTKDDLRTMLQNNHVGTTTSGSSGSTGGDTTSGGTTDVGGSAGTDATDTTDSSATTTDTSAPADSVDDSTSVTDTPSDTGETAQDTPINTAATE